MDAADIARMELLDVYRQSMRARLNEMQSVWDALRRGPENASALGKLKAELHALKGESNMMGFEEIAELVAGAERLVKTAVEIDVPLPTDTAVVVAAAQKVIERLLERSPGSENGDLDVESVLSRFEALVATLADPSGMS